MLQHPSGNADLRPGTPTAGARAVAAGGRDSFLDVLKGIAIARVLVWHTWGWWWLSWIPAMPAMFFVAGSLLDDSLERHGTRYVLRTRLRRLLLPFWVYSAFCLAVMFSMGWRPGLGQLVWWVIPLGDPVGSTAAAGLWIPLWYLRAYLWFLLAAPLLRALTARFGRASLLFPVAATLFIWLLARRGYEVPLGVGDAATYSIFVIAGMLYHRGVFTRRSMLFVAGASCFGAALLWITHFGPKSGIVNASYPLVLLVGCAGVLFAIVAAPALRHPTANLDRLIRFVCSRAVTIYLWQGFGLLAADRLVGDFTSLNGPADAAGALAIVLLVTAVGVWAFGWVEDVAARRPARVPTVRLLPVGVAACVVMGTAIVREPDESRRDPLVPSGQAIVARGALVEQDLQQQAAPVQPSLVPAASEEEAVARVNEAFATWISENTDVLQALGTRNVAAAVVDARGAVTLVRWSGDDDDSADDDLVPWWSITKVVTTAWLTRAVDTGVVTLKDPLSKYLPHVPFADRITLNQLARHLSGIPESVSPSVFEGNPSQELAHWMNDPSLRSRPGKEFHYSRLNYYLLALALEQATATSWVDTVRSFADAAGVRLVIDDEVFPLAEISDPGSGTYRGGLWASGGILATSEESVRFFRWLMTDGVSTSGRKAMTKFLNSESKWYYGLALTPLCPCQAAGRFVQTDRYGLDSAGGSFAFDQLTSATVFLAPNVWFTDSGPAVQFYDLERSLLDAAT